MVTLESLHFDNLVLRRLPKDPEERNYVRIVSGACFSKVSPTPVENPVTVAYSKSAMSLLDLPDTELERNDFAEYFSGNKLLPGAEPAAHCYCGHQFGLFSGQLGDSAVMYLGEVINNKGERWEIQLKGAGSTPYSQAEDGRILLRSSIREFLCSEVMHYLGIPTTRSGCCITSDHVIRDTFFDGRPVKEEKCSVILRIAPTFIRFGSFEIFKTLDPATGRCGPSVGRYEILRALLDYTIETFYPEIDTTFKNNSGELKYAAFFKQVVFKTARLVALWQCFGFCHGILNTDNMSIVGLTIDYGPYGFLDMYNSDHTFNNSDRSGRYCYIKQPKVCLWNLTKLAEAIENALPLSISRPLLDLFETEFNMQYLDKMKQKLGLITKESPNDTALIEELLDTMENTGADFTNPFRCMCFLILPGLPEHEISCEVLLNKILDQCYPLDILLKHMRYDMDNRHVQTLLRLFHTNPELARTVEDQTGMNLNRIAYKRAKIAELEKLSSIEKKCLDKELWRKWIATYVGRLKYEVDDVFNRQDLQKIQKERMNVMNSINPKFILRNYIAQNAIAKAEAGDFEEVRNVLKRLKNPFGNGITMENLIEPTCSSKIVDTNIFEDTSNQRLFAEIFALDDLPPDSCVNLRIRDRQRLSPDCG